MTADALKRKASEAIAVLDALELARESLALGGADVDECTVNTLARAVIAQHEELERAMAQIEGDAIALLMLGEDVDRLRAALREACDLHDEMSHVGWGYDSDVKRHEVADARIAELRRLCE